MNWDLVLDIAIILGKSLLLLVCLLVLNCAAGRRSAMALDKCEAARVEVDTHLAGGFGAWLAAGLQAEA